MENAFFCYKKKKRILETIQPLSLIIFKNSPTNSNQTNRILSKKKLIFIENCERLKCSQFQEALKTIRIFIKIILIEVVEQTPKGIQPDNRPQGQSRQVKKKIYLLLAHNFHGVYF